MDTSEPRAWYANVRLWMMAYALLMAVVLAVGSLFDLPVGLTSNVMDLLVAAFIVTGFAWGGRDAIDRHVARKAAQPAADV